MSSVVKMRGTEERAVTQVLVRFTGLRESAEAAARALNEFARTLDPDVEITAGLVDESVWGKAPKRRRKLADSEEEPGPFGPECA